VGVWQGLCSASHYNDLHGLGRVARLLGVAIRIVLVMMTVVMTVVMSWMRRSHHRTKKLRVLFDKIIIEFRSALQLSHPPRMFRILRNKLFTFKFKFLAVGRNGAPGQRFFLGLGQFSCERDKLMHVHYRLLFLVVQRVVFC
jgi:hypothetical protein